MGAEPDDDSTLACDDRPPYHPPTRMHWLTIALTGVGLLAACAEPERPTTPTTGPTLTPTPTQLPARHEGPGADRHAH